jgi:hypothetical protein
MLSFGKFVYRSATHNLVFIGLPLFALGKKKLQIFLHLTIQTTVLYLWSSCSVHVNEVLL